MPFYKVTQDSGAIALKLSVKNPDKKHFPKFQVVGQDLEKFVVIRVPVPEGALGLYLGDGISHRVGKPEDNIPMVILLVGEQALYFYRQNVTLVSEEEIEGALNNGKPQETA